MKRKRETDRPMPVLISADGNLKLHPIPGFQLPLPNDHALVFDQGTEMVSYKCGHVDSWPYSMKVYGVVLTLTDEQKAEKDYCSECHMRIVLGMSIRCGLCGDLVTQGDSVAAYRIRKGFLPYSHRVKIRGIDCVLGCSSCAPDKEFLAGTWLYNEFVSGGEEEARARIAEHHRNCHRDVPHICSCGRPECPNGRAGGN